MMTRNPKRIGTVVAALALVLACGGVFTAGAQVLEERTTLTFSEPVRIPGQTLPAGMYVFELVAPDSTPHVIQITNAKTSHVMAMVPAIPTRRDDASSNTVLQFNPTETGAAAAIEAWFYPASVHGHQFVYPEDEAREIATRTKTVVLSMAREDGSHEGELVLYDESGGTSPFVEDEDGGEGSAD